MCEEIDRSTDIFKAMLDSGCKVERIRALCGGGYMWLKPRDDGSLERWGCVCHDTPKKMDDVING